MKQITRLFQTLGLPAVLGFLPLTGAAQDAAALVRAGQPTTAEAIGEFALRVGSKDLDKNTRALLKRNILDTLGCAIGALGAEPVQAVRKVVDEFGGSPQCTLIGGGKTSADRAALFNGCLVRYLDFMDNFVVQGAVSHPADTFAAILAAAEQQNRSGEDFLIALAVTYQVECRLLETVPTMSAGINNTTPDAFAVAAGASRLLGLDKKQAANAIALAGVDCITLAIVQAEPLSHWKGLSAGEVGMRALHNTYLAGADITGPIGIFEGPFGLAQLTHKEPGIAWKKEELDVIGRTSIKKHNAEFQGQSALEAVLMLRKEHKLTGKEKIARVTVDVPRGAYEVIGGGSYGPKDSARIKEQADHNLRYLVAVALLDGEVWPAQFTPERINRADVQTLMQRVVIQPNSDFTLRIPKEAPARVTIDFEVGDKTLQQEVSDYEGFFTKSMTWEKVAAKFNRLAAPHADEELRGKIITAVADLENIKVADLTALLAQASAKAVPVAATVGSGGAPERASVLPAKP